MTTMTRFVSLAALAGAAVLASCTGYDKNTLQTIDGPVAAQAAVRFFNFGVNAPGVNFYADAVKLTAISSTTGVESTNGVTYGNVGSNGDYSAVTPGSHALTAKIAATTDKDLSIAPVTAQLDAGKYYSYYMSGFYNTTSKTVEAFVVNDPIPTVDFSKAYVRFVNAISNSQPMTLYAKSTTTAVESPVGAAIAYKSAGDFVALAPDVYDLNTRVTGSSTNVITRTGVSFLGGHVYTISSRGDITVTGSTATNRPVLDNTANR